MVRRIVTIDRRVVKAADHCARSGGSPQKVADWRRESSPQGHRGTERREGRGRSPAEWISPLPRSSIENFTFLQITFKDFKSELPASHSPSSFLSVPLCPCGDSSPRASFTSRRKVVEPNTGDAHCIVIMTETIGTLRSRCTTRA